MILVRDAGLVILELPKTATQALRGLLERRAEIGFDGAERHVGAKGYQKHHAAAAERACGRVPETVAVVRAPLERLQSWHRYLSRDKVRGTPRSTEGVDFAAFVEAVLAPDPPAFARVGRQDRFVGWDGRTAQVDHLFDHARLDRLEAFLTERMGAPMILPARNASPPRAVEPLPAPLSARLRVALAGEYALYAAVADAGHLRRGGNGPQG